MYRSVIHWSDPGHGSTGQYVLDWSDPVIGIGEEFRTGKRRQLPDAFESG